ncbi:class I SAM-dependent methyltransferase [Novosphingobium sp.]|uniref:class I SAM-dependent methyltransferase n=1 Tax=Novosphingobium sp. TaxID=1874826 RepID=UPI00261139A6|nr:class I SAM-dependent methyltransferase [Novosphingobium sp.]
MSAQQQHYDALLAELYSWMAGRPFAETVAEQEALLRDLGVIAPGRCLDLGCGSGYQALALARLGASEVHALDTSTRLLAELEGYAAGHPVTGHLADITAFETAAPGPFDTIVCMGDTLPHLASTADVERMLRAAAAHLALGGLLVLSWRDMVQPPQGLDRFIPVRMTDDRIMLCFVEDTDEGVMVHDLVFEKGAANWTLAKSAYPKLKLPEGDVRRVLVDAGLVVGERRSVRGMTVLTAHKPAS